MKNRSLLRETIFSLVIIITLSAPLIHSSAQSGRIIPKPAPNPQAAPAPTPKPKFVPDPSAPRYRLIFPREFELKFKQFEGETYFDSEETERSRFNKLIDELNDAGAHGYKVLSVVDGSMILVERTDKQYEYMAFQSTDGPGVLTSGFANAYVKIARMGFRVAHRSLARLHEVTRDPEDHSADGDALYYREFFVFEREAGSETPIVYKLILPRGNGELETELRGLVSEYIAAGYYPSYVLSEYELLVEQANERVERMLFGSDVQVVMASQSYWGRDDLPKKVNVLAQQGFRLAMISHKLAVMYRTRANAKPTSYVWLSVGKRDWLYRRQTKDFQKELTKLLEEGAVYRFTYPSDEGDKNRLVFEERVATPGTRREYRILRLMLQRLTDDEAKKATEDLTPESKDNWEDLRNLVAEGFEIRDLIVTEGACVLLERELPGRNAKGEGRK